MSIEDYPKQVGLKNGRTAVIRLLGRDDLDRLLGFFRDLPDEDRMFLRHDVCDETLIRKWTQQLDLDHVIPLVAVDGDTIVADGTLHITTHGWMQHVGHVRLVTAKSHRRTGLGTILARELVNLAERRGLEKLQAHVIEDNVGSVQMFANLGFDKVAVLRDMVKDRHGKNRHLAIMINDVSKLGRIMEDWIQDSMIPAFRVPGGAEG
ncbi:MAG: GNAT family N-acetyltransferase [Planctomycetota bacterium]|jgi:L-amino acid N-acyltransferase YncA